MKKYEGKLTKQDVMELLPQRDPILLIDSADDLVPGKSVVAHFLVKPEMEVFKGHFPGNPVFPGVYTMEACAQASILCATSLERYFGKTTLYLGINNAKFKGMVKPGDTINLHVTVTGEREEKAIVFTHIDVEVEGNSVVEADVVMAYR